MGRAKCKLATRKPSNFEIAILTRISLSIFEKCASLNRRLFPGPFNRPKLYIWIHGGLWLFVFNAGTCVKVIGKWTGVEPAKAAPSLLEQQLQCKALKIPIPLESSFLSNVTQNCDAKRDI